MTSLVASSLLWLCCVPAGEDPLAGAQSRIEQHRKGEAVVAVRDRAGQPLPGVKIEIEQTRHAFLFGCNLFLWGKAGREPDEETYRTRFAELFNYATLPFYWPSYEPNPGQPDRERLAGMAIWCRKQGIVTKGHPLAWNHTDPKWLPEDPAEALALQLDRINLLVAGYRGLIDRWDVVNEPTHYEREESRRRAPRLTAMWDHAGRVPFVLECLRRARAASPDAILLVNDYRTDDAFARLLDELVQKAGGKAPFDAIGLQSHQHSGAWPEKQVWDVCERFARFGVPLHFTESTILSGERGYERPRPWPSTPEGESRQAEEVERFYTLLFSHPSVQAITWWDLADRGAWQGAPAGLLRNDLSPKPAYERLRELIKGRWWTRATLLTNEQGEARFRGFLGDYRIKAPDLAGPSIETEATLQKADGEPVRVELVAHGSR